MLQGLETDKPENSANIFSNLKHVKFGSPLNVKHLQKYSVKQPYSITILH